MPGAPGWAQVYDRETICLPLQAGPPSPFTRSHAIGHGALQQYFSFHLDHLSPYFPAVSGDAAIVPSNATTSLQAFIEELKPILDTQQLPDRAFDWIFHDEHLLTKPHPNCGGRSLLSLVNTHNKHMLHVSCPF